MTTRPSFISELRRRRVFRVLGVYAGAAFAFLEFVDIVAPVFQLPDWSTALTLTILSLGFPVAGILAWVYDITPDGLVKTSEETDSLPQHKPFTSNIIIGVLIIVILGLLIYPKIKHDSPSTETPSIAIMLIENIGDKADEFWTRGITEDVIIELASAGRIRVTPIQEILKYSASNLSITEIADELRVKYLLTSSLYKTEEGFDLRTQLVEAETGRSIYANKWSETDERSSAITGQLASSILRELNISKKTAISPVFTPNSESYEFYLKGKFRYETRENMEDTRVAQGLLTEAIALDSLFANARIQLGKIHSGLGELETAQIIFTDCLSMTRRNNDRLGEARSLVNLGNVYSHRGWYDEALGLYEASLIINREVGGREGEGHALNNIGIIQYRRGNTKVALDYYNQALEIRKELGNRRDVARALINMANCHKDLGDHETALKVFDEALQISREMGNVDGEAQVFNNTGTVYLDLGDYDEALKRFHQGLEIHQKLGNRREAARVLVNIGNIQARRGNYDEALVRFTAALELRREVGDQSGEASSLIGLGMLFQQQEDFEQALSFYKEHNALVITLGEKRDIGFSFQTLGELYLLTDETTEAQEAFHQAVQIWIKMEDDKNRIWSQSWEVLAIAKAGDLSKVPALIQELETLLSTTDPFPMDAISIHWNLSQIHALLEDHTRSDAYLHSAYEHLQGAANDLGSDEDRTLFLTTVRANREITAAWEVLNKQSHLPPTK